MKSQEKKEYLRAVAGKDVMLSSMYTKVSNLYEQATNITAKWGSEKVQGGKSNAMEDVLVKLADELNKLEIEQSLYFRQVANVQTAMSALTFPKQRQVLELRYFKGMKWQDIAKELSVDVSAVYKLHGRALYNLPLSE